VECRKGWFLENFSLVKGLHYLAVACNPEARACKSGLGFGKGNSKLQRKPMIGTAKFQHLRHLAARETERDAKPMIGGSR
jgi:hypothetical protein